MSQVIKESEAGKHACPWAWIAGNETQDGGRCLGLICMCWQWRLNCDGCEYRDTDDCGSKCTRDREYGFCDHP